MTKMKERNPVRKKELLFSLPGGRELRFLVAADIEALITDLSDADQVPCWADIWPAAHGLAHHLWDDLQIGPGKRVIELGAGMGLPGIVCALKGARVMLSDFNQTALEMSAENARQNGLHVELQLADWRSFHCREEYDYILASDILYDPVLNPFLGQIFAQNLKPGGEVLIAHPDRRVTREFVENCAGYGLLEQQRHLRLVELADSLLPRDRIIINVLQLISNRPPDGAAAGCGHD